MISGINGSPMHFRAAARLENCKTVLLSESADSRHIHGTGGKKKKDAAIQACFALPH